MGPCPNCPAQGMAYASCSSLIPSLARPAGRPYVHPTGDGSPRGSPLCGWSTGSGPDRAGQGHGGADPSPCQGEPPDPHQRRRQQLRHQLWPEREQAAPLRHRPAHGQMQQGSELYPAGDAGRGVSVHLQPGYPQPQGAAGDQEERIQTPATTRALHQLGWRPGHGVAQRGLARRHPTAGCLLETGGGGQTGQADPDPEQRERRPAAARAGQGSQVSTVQLGSGERLFPADRSLPQW